jgi:2,5-diketo-D-gluconate reductase A
VSTTQSPTVTIAPGVDMPLVGIGTWQASGGKAYEAVRLALEIGYRHIDTATMYANEDEVGRAVRDSGLPREQVFITTKLLASSAGRERETIEASLRLLGTAYVDLWLIHWPPNGGAAPKTWQQFIEVRDEGLVRAIGVSNYDARLVDQLIDATGVTPAVDQIEWSPALYDASVADALRARNVTLEGYSPFKTSDVRERVLGEIAQRHGVTPHQVIVRWHIEHGFVVIPKSTNRERIAANFDVFGFTLDDDEVARIDALGR